MKYKWVIGICDTEGDGVDLVGFYGTEDEMKAKLVEMVQNDREYSDSYVGGTESVDEVAVRYSGTELYACGSYSCYHIDYSAKRLDDFIFY